MRCRMNVRTQGEPSKRAPPPRTRVSPLRGRLVVAHGHALADTQDVFIDLGLATLALRHPDAHAGEA